MRQAHPAGHSTVPAGAGAGAGGRVLHRGGSGRRRRAGRCVRASGTGPRRGAPILCVLCGSWRWGGGGRWRQQIPAQGELAPGVYCLQTGRGITKANVYLVRSGPAWVLNDTALPRRGQIIAAAAESLFGTGTRPAAILLTHSHPDHAGSALELACTRDLAIHVHLCVPRIASTALPSPRPKLLDLEHANPCHDLPKRHLRQDNVLAAELWPERRTGRPEEIAGDQRATTVDPPLVFLATPRGPFCEVFAGHQPFTPTSRRNLSLEEFTIIEVARPSLSGAPGHMPRGGWEAVERDLRRPMPDQLRSQRQSLLRRAARDLLRELDRVAGPDEQETRETLHMSPPPSTCGVTAGHPNDSRPAVHGRARPRITAPGWLFARPRGAVLAAPGGAPGSPGCPRGHVVARPIRAPPQGRSP